MSKLINAIVQKARFIIDGNQPWLPQAIRSAKRMIDEKNYFSPILGFQLKIPEWFKGGEYVS